MGPLGEANAAPAPAPVKIYHLSSSRIKHIYAFDIKILIVKLKITHAVNGINLMRERGMTIFVYEQMWQSSVPE